MPDEKTKWNWDEDDLEIEAPPEDDDAEKPDAKDDQADGKPEE